MNHMFSSDVAFTPSVKTVQASRKARPAHVRIEEHGGFRTEITDDLRGFIAEVDTAFLGTANTEGQPYVQHRGGPKGFIRVVDNRTLGFADYVGNRQYITTGNLLENDRAYLILMDYAHRRRVKIWGRARVVDDDPALVAALMPEDYAARPEQAILFKVDAWDINCPQHIPQKFDAADVADLVRRLQAHVAELETEIKTLRAATLLQTTGDQP